MKEKNKEGNMVLPASVSEENLAMWKAKYRKISSITVEDGEDSYTAFFRRPDMTIISAVSKVAQTDEIKAAMVMFENCWLGGDEMIREDAVIQMAVLGKLQDLMKVTTASLKNW